MIHSRRRFLIGAPLILGAMPAWGAPAVKKSIAPKPKLIALDPGHGGADPGALGVGGTGGEEEQRAQTEADRARSGPWRRRPRRAGRGGHAGKGRRDPRRPNAQ